MLSKESVLRYEEDGFVFVEDVMTDKEVALLSEQAENELQMDGPRRVLEKDGKTVRGVHGSHQTSEVFARLVRHPSLLLPAMQVLGGPVYVHQFKINAKKAMQGDIWPWHQDYIFWNRGDGMQRPAVVNVAILLDAATVINGPLLFVPGSHRSGSLELTARGPADSWKSSFSADLDYAIDAPLLARLTADKEIVAITGPPGSILLFDPLLVHGSGTNMSVDDRRMVLVTYNRTDNPLVAVPNPRPTFLAARDNTPLDPLGPEETLFP